MSDSTMFLVDYELVKFRYEHAGIIGRGRDIYLDLPCTVHLMQDRKENKKRAMQVFHNLSNELNNKKIEQLTKSAFNYCVPGVIKLLFISFRRNETSFDLVAMYDMESVGDSLEETIQKRKASNKPFSEGEIIELLACLSDTLYMSSRLSYEYLDLNPMNIFFSEKEKWLLSNFGLITQRKFEKRISNPADSFFSTKIMDRNIEMYMRCAVFQVAMLVLYAATLEDPSDLFQDLFNSEQRGINGDKLTKRIEAAKNKKIGDKLVGFLNEALVLKEEKRVTLDVIVKERGKTYFGRDITYFQGKHPNAPYFSGFIKGEGDKAVFHHICDILYPNGSLYKGMVVDGKKSGYGAFFNGTNMYFIGHWQNDALTSGTIIRKGGNIYLGGIADNKPNGSGILVMLTSNQNSSTVMLFDGEFSSGSRTNGIILYRDGSIYSGPLKNDSRAGKGIHWFTPKRDLIKVYEGEFQDDMMHGVGYMYENDNEFEMEYETGVEKKVDPVPEEKRKKMKPSINQLFNQALNEKKKAEPNQQQKVEGNQQQKAEGNQQQPRKK